MPRVEQTLRNQNFDANNSINRLAEEIAEIAAQQRPQASTMLKPVSTNSLFFDGKRENRTFGGPISHNAQNATRDDRSLEI